MSDSHPDHERTLRDRRLRVIAGSQVYFDWEGFLWDGDDWNEAIAEVMAHEDGLSRLDDVHWRLIQGLAEQENIDLYGARHQVDRTAVLSSNIKGMDATDVSAILDADFNIAVRAGQHCAPLVHRQMGTLERGTVRFSIGLFNSREHIDQAVEAMKAIARNSC